MGTMSFHGGTARAYAQYRSGYPAEVIDALEARFGLSQRDTVLDLGCGTGLLTIPLAPRSGLVIGMDPEPDMLAAARQAATRAGAENALWVLGADTDIPAVRALAGERGLAAVTIGDALHWMRPADLFPAVLPMLRAGGGVAVITNGAAPWRQDAPWSRTLREGLQEWFGSPVAAGVEDARHRRYAGLLAAAGLGDVRIDTLSRQRDSDLGHLIGTVCSSIPDSALPGPEDRQALADHLARTLAPQTRFTEDVTIVMITALQISPARRPAG